MWLELDARSAICIPFISCLKIGFTANALDFVVVICKEQFALVMLTECIAWLLPCELTRKSRRHTGVGF